MRHVPRLPASAAAALAMAVLIAVFAAAPASAAFPGRDGRIVYSWFDHRESELEPQVALLDQTAIRAIAPRGGQPATLRGCTRTAGQLDVGDCTIAYLSPAVSPDGQSVVFDSGRALALMRIDGGDFRLLAPHSDDDGDPAFSADGTHLIFSAGAGPGTRGIWIADLRGENPQRVTARGTSPAWSTRNWVAFLRANGVYRVRPNGRGLRRLVARTRCTDVAWSPRGTKLAFTCRDRLYVVNGDGSHLRRIPVAASAVAWSPRGTRFAISPFDGGVDVVRTDGTHQRQLVAGGVGATYGFGAGAVDWQPLH